MSVTSACVRDPEVEQADRAPVPYEYPSSYATGLGATVNGLYRHACRVGSYRGEYPPTRVRSWSDVKSGLWWHF